MTSGSKNTVIAAGITVWLQNRGCRGCTLFGLRMGYRHRSQLSWQLHMGCTRHRQLFLQPG